VSELPKISNRGAIINTSSLSGVIEATEVRAHSIVIDNYFPGLSFWIWINSLKSRFCLCSYESVGAILLERAWTEIAIPVVQSIVIFVVNLFALYTDDLAMHINCSIALCTGGIKTASLGYGMPFPLAQAIISLGQHCYLLALCQWNVATGFSINVKNLFRYLGFARLNPTITAMGGHPSFHSTTFTVVIKSGLRLFLGCKISSRLSSQFPLVHDQPPKLIVRLGRTPILYRQQEMATQ
jgi:hypothetical protein